MTTANPQPAGLGPRDILAIPNFRLVWLAQVISDFGDGLTNLALLITINRLTGSTAALALLAMTWVIPQATIGMLAGVYVDRFDRRRLMIASDILRGLLVLGFCFVQDASWVPVLYVLSFAQAAVGTFFMPARHALVPSLVPQNGLLAANSLSQISRISAGLLGTAAAGVLLGTVGITWPAFSVDALTFFASAVLVTLVRVQANTAATATPATPAPTTGTRAALAALGTELRTGLGVIRASSALTGALVAGAVSMLGLGATNVLFVPLLVNDLKVPETWFAGIDFAQTASMILSGSIVALLAARLSPGKIISLAMFLTGLLVAALALVSNVWHVVLVLFGIGWVMTPLQASIATLMQSNAAPEVRGRVGASLNTAIALANMLSMAFAGALGDVVGVRNVFVLSGVLVVCAGAANLFIMRGESAPAPALPAITSPAGAHPAVSGVSGTHDSGTTHTNDSVPGAAL